VHNNYKNMARPKSEIERKRRVLYCASNMTNKELVELIETGVNESGPCTECDRLQDELNKCAQELTELKSKPVNVHNNENKSAQKPAPVPNYIKNNVDLASLQALASCQKIDKPVEPVQGESEIDVPKMGQAMAQGFVNQFADLIRRGCPDWACKTAIASMKDAM